MKLEHVERCRKNIKRYRTTPNANHICYKYLERCDKSLSDFSNIYESVSNHYCINLFINGLNILCEDVEDRNYNRIMGCSGAICYLVEEYKFKTKNQII